MVVIIPIGRRIHAASSDGVSEQSVKNLTEQAIVHNKIYTLVAGGIVTIGRGCKIYLYGHMLVNVLILPHNAFVDIRTH